MHLCRRTLLAAPFAGLSVGVGKATGGEPVDLLLVLAADASDSMASANEALQREGHGAALLDADALADIEAGAHGAIGVAYVEWAGAEEQCLLLPWTRIASRSDAHAWATCLMAAKCQRFAGESDTSTSISGALDLSMRLLAGAPWATARRVIDISGDGPSNTSPPTEQARDRAVAQGITINGLTIASDKHHFVSGTGMMRLDAYYRDAVAGGPGAFVVTADGISDFADALRRKLTREIAGGRRAGEVNRQAPDAAAPTHAPERHIRRPRRGNREGHPGCAARPAAGPAGATAPSDAAVATKSRGAS
jgi:hypothetical protein